MKRILHIVGTMDRAGAETSASGENVSDVFEAAVDR